MKFNIDVSGVECGATIEQSICESVIGIKRMADRYQYQFELMQLASHIQDNLWAEGKRFTVVTQGGLIRVLTHEQASVHNAKRFDGAISKMGRCHKRLMAVDTGKLSQEAKADHEKFMVKQSRMVQMIGAAKAKIELVAHDNKMPVRIVR